MANLIHIKTETSSTNHQGRPTKSSHFLLLGLSKTTVWGGYCPVNSDLDEVQAIEKWGTEFELANMYSIQYSPIKKNIDFD